MATPDATHLNPFSITKAVDFSDDQIQSTWVDLESGGGFLSLVSPTAPMPRILLGGKGTGRTHLMRYFSAPLQRLRGEGSPWAGPIRDGYLGIYMRCSGLNAGRFAGKGIEDEVWASVFTYSMDLALAELALTNALSTFSGMDELVAAEADIVGSIVACFDSYPRDHPGTLAELSAHLRGLQSDVDLAVNNAALRRNLEGVVIRVGRGILPFAVPQAFAVAVPEVRPLVWVYLIDELENLTVEQQRYVQTLVREREAPASLVLGSRLYGFRTSETLSAGEENKEGSEFTAIVLEQHYLRHPASFASFCRRVVARRLIEAEWVVGERDEVAERLDEYFAGADRRRGIKDVDVSFVLRDDEAGRERRYLAALRDRLDKHTHRGETEVGNLVEALRLPDDPLLERLNVYLLYQAWRGSRDLEQEACEIHRLASEFAELGTKSGYNDKIKHYAPDVYGKLLHEYGEKQRYLGLDTFIQMSGGLPRNLLILLKNTFRWAQFNGERPFVGEAISARSQRDGVLESADWFLRDSLPLGEAGRRVEIAVSWVADLLRALRFADTPPEVGLSTVSIDEKALSTKARRTLRDAVEWSLLVQVRDGQRDKNTGALKQKFQLNPMVCPKWDLPLSRRGALDLSSGEVEIIFGSQSSESFDAVRKVRVARATAPFRPGPEQPSLLDG